MKKVKALEENVCSSIQRCFVMLQLAHPWP